MDAAFAGEVAKCVFAVDFQRGALDACTFAELDVHGGDFVFVALGPAHIHAHEHVGPILRFGAACAAVDGEEAVAVVAGAVEELLDFKGIHRFQKAVVFMLEVGHGAGVFFCEIDQDGDVVGALFEGEERMHFLAEHGDFLHLGLGAFLVVPEVLLAHEAFELIEAFL